MSLALGIRVFDGADCPRAIPCFFTVACAMQMLALPVAPPPIAAGAPTPVLPLPQVAIPVPPPGVLQLPPLPRAPPAPVAPPAVLPLLPCIPLQPIQPRHQVVEHQENPPQTRRRPKREVKTRPTKIQTRSRTKQPVTEPVEAVFVDGEEEDWENKLEESSKRFRSLKLDSMEDVHAARATQVRLMMAARPDKNAPRIRWPEPSKEALDRFSSLAPATRWVTSNYAGTQLRMLFLLDIEEPRDRHRRFDQECFIRRLAPTTAETYWIAWLSISKACQLELTHEDRAFTAALVKRSRTYPVRFPQPLLKDDVATLFRVGNGSPLVSMIAACWHLGQRIGDFIQVAAANIKPSALGEVAILMDRGKTIDQGHVPPYYVYLESDHEVSRHLLAAKHVAMANGWLYILSPTNSDGERRAIEQRIRHILRRVSRNVELRSIRRGGLQHLASSPNVSLEQVRLHSQHKSVNMLMRYLDHGFHSRAREESMLSAVRAMNTGADFSLTKTSKHGSMFH